ncbi:MAG: NAD/NADP octopine/nopaline dehydrogenase family protein [Nitrospinota bacterium]
MAKVAVLGAGGGGQTIAADLTLDGHSVRLYEHPKFAASLRPVRRRGGILITGSGRNRDFARIDLVTTDVRQAVRGADLVVVVVPCFGHRPMGEALCRHLQDGQVVAFLGEGSGSLVFRQVLEERRKKTRRRKGPDVIYGETNTLPYLTRITGPAQVTMGRKRGGTLAAAFPAANNRAFVSTLQEFWPFIEPATHVFETILINFNAIDHVSAVLFNAGRIEGSTMPFLLWGEGATPSVVRCIEAVDAEILNLRKALGCRDRSTYKDFQVRQGMVEEPQKTTYDAIHKGLVGKGTFPCGPDALKFRYITEDVPYTLVLISDIGRLMGVPTPMNDALITVASVMNQDDYRSWGRTLKSLGLGRLKKRNVRKFLRTGRM